MGNVGDDELRTLRDRLLDLERRAGRLPRAPYGTPAVLGRVVGGDSTPTSLPGRFLVRRQTGSYVPAERETPSYAAAGAGFFVVTVIGDRLPAVGDVLLCYGVRGRWAAESR
jgi:hypothetical protein